MASIKAIQHRLENGLRVVVSQDHHLPLAGVALYYDVGARDEEKGKTGFAHLFEHLMFEGSAHVEKGSHFSLISGLGGQINANTTHERTAYFASVPSHQVDVVLWMEADRMRSLIVDEQSFEHQRQTVLEERKQRVDNVPFGSANERFSALCQRSFAYAHPVIGYEQDIVDASLEDVRDFHERFYRPSNAVLAVAGDVEAEAVIRRVEDWFGDIAPGETRPSFFLEESQEDRKSKLIVAEERAQLSKVMIRHPAPSYGDSDFFAFEMAETILLRGPSSRAWRRLVIEERAAVQISGGYTARRAASGFALSGMVEQPHQMDRVVALWQEELDRFAHQPILKPEWDKALNQLHASHVYAQEGVLSRALSTGRYALMLNNPDWLESYMTSIEALNVKSVQEVVGACLSAQNRMELHAVAKGGRK